MSAFASTPAVIGKPYSGAQLAVAVTAASAAALGFAWLWCRPRALYSIRTTIEIDASSHHVFRVRMNDIYMVLTNEEEIEKWGVYIKKVILGSRKLGERITVITHLPTHQLQQHSHPILLAFATGVELRWVGGLQGLYRCEHFFLLTPLSENKCRVDHGEEISGLLVPFMRASVSETKMGFDLFNAALKLRAETQ